MAKSLNGTLVLIESYEDIFRQLDLFASTISPKLGISLESMEIKNFKNDAFVEL